MCLPQSCSCKSIRPRNSKKKLRPVRNPKKNHPNQTKNIFLLEQREQKKRDDCALYNFQARIIVKKTTPGGEQKKNAPPSTGGKNSPALIFFSPSEPVSTFFFIPTTRHHSTRSTPPAATAAPPTKSPSNPNRLHDSFPGHASTGGLQLSSTAPKTSHWTCGQRCL